MLIPITDRLHAEEGISGWQVREIRKKSLQWFLNKERTESRRQVDSRTFEVEVLVNHVEKRGGGKERATGSSRFVTDEASFGRFEEDLRSAVFAASLVKNQAYSMTDPGPWVPNLSLADPALGASGFAPLAALSDRIRQAAGREAGMRLGAAEFFADTVQVRHVNSQGLQAAQETSLLSWEFALVSDDPSGEVFRTGKRRRLSDFDLEGDLAAAAESLRRRASAGPPATGRFDVVFSGEALDHLFDFFAAQASAAAKYNRLTLSEPGKPLLQAGPGASAFHLWHDATLPWAVGSYRVDPSGVPGCRRMLVEDGVLRAYWANSRYAQYLGIPATGELGNLVVAPGKHGDSGLLEAAGGRPLYHLFEFSYFEPNPVTGEFSAEIRGGEEIGPGGRRPVKGGSVSGNSAQAIGSAKFSASTVQRERYQGPGLVRCENLTLAGD